MTPLQLYGGFWCDSGWVSAGEINAAALTLSQQTGWTAPPINDCADRAAFATVLLAATHGGHACLLPGNSAPEALAELCRLSPGAALLRTIDPPALRSGGPVPGMLQVRPEQVVTTAFTSGSTRQPRPIRKSWRAQAGVVSRMTELAIAWGVAGAHVVATVPPQHTFGLEMSVLMALLGGWNVASGRPFYPADIIRALAALPSPRLLVTTPVHLRTLLSDASPLPELAMILSATAPLDAELARSAEAHFGCAVREIYGSTETGAIASRRTTQGHRWELLPRVVFERPPESLVQADHLAADTHLPDRLEVHDPRHFTLLGRPEGMLKVGGKRSSTAAVQQALLAIPGVRDAEVFLLPERERPVGLVVAPELNLGQLRRALALSIDPVFIPRPLRRVDAIPRNSTGKALRQDLLACWQRAAPTPPSSQA